PPVIVIGSVDTDLRKCPANLVDFPGIVVDVDHARRQQIQLAQDGTYILGLRQIVDFYRRKVTEREATVENFVEPLLRPGLLVAATDRQQAASRFVNKQCLRKPQRPPLGKLGEGPVVIVGSRTSSARNEACDSCAT